MITNSLFSKTSWVGMLVILFLPVACVAEPAPDAAVQDKINTLQQTLLDAQKNAKQEDRGELMQDVSYLRELRRSVNREDYNNALNAVNNLSAPSCDAADPVQKQITALSKALESWRDATDKALESKTQATLDQVTKAIESAKDPKDLDGVLTSVAKALDEGNNRNYSAVAQIQRNKLEQAKNFIQQWQSYLADKAAGNTQQTANDLRNLSSNGTYSPIPRSEILALIAKETGNPEAGLSAIQVHDFDDLPKAIHQLEALERSGNYFQDINNTLNALQTLLAAYQNTADKNYIAALQSLSNSYPFGQIISEGRRRGLSGIPENASLRQELLRLKNKLLVEITQGLLNRDGVTGPKEDERAEDYLLRLAAGDAKAANWLNLQQDLQVYAQFQAYGPNPHPWLQEDLTGLQAYLVGQKLEAAGQNLDAIRSYRQSLATLGKFFPADAPASRLNELAKKYPGLYQQALQQTIGK